MNDLISNLTERILAGTYRAPERGTYTPTLIVGLGGTGIKVLRQLKRDLSLHGNHHVNLLGIDSDLVENTRTPSEFPSLDLGSELKILDQAQAMRMLVGAAANTGNRHVLDFLPKKNGKRNGIHELVHGKINQQKGAGQFRRAGKLLFCANVSAGANLDDTFAKIRMDLIGLPTTLAREGAGYTIDNGIKIYVVGSIAGGQGAGCLIDCLALLRKHFSGNHDVITALCVLPGPLFDKRVGAPVEEAKTMRANGIAVLRELQAIQQGHLHDHEFIFDQNTRFRPGALPLLNDIYLVDHHSHKMVPFHDLLDLCKGVASFLYAFIGTGMGAHQDSARINGKVNNQAGTDGMLKTFNALGVGAMMFPASEVAEYGIRDALNRWLEKWINAKPAKQNRDAVGTLLASWQLDSLDSFRSRLQPEIPEAIYLGDAAQRREVMKMSDPDFLSKGQAKLDAFPSILEGYHKEFDTKQDEVFGSLNQSLSEQLSLWLSNGAQTADDCLNAMKSAISGLHAAFQEARDERNRTNEALEDRKQVLIGKINFWDFGLDTKPRQEYIAVINQMLALKFQEGSPLFSVE